MDQFIFPFAFRPQVIWTLTSKLVFQKSFSVFYFQKNKLIFNPLLRIRISRTNLSLSRFCWMTSPLIGQPPHHHHHPSTVLEVRINLCTTSLHTTWFCITASRSIVSIPVSCNMTSGKVSFLEWTLPDGFQRRDDITFALARGQGPANWTCFWVSLWDIGGRFP